jgi:hypothetical protein
VSESFFWRLQKNFRDFFIAFLNSPCYETPKNAIKKNRAKQPREGEKETEGEKTTFFVMSPDGFFGGNCRVFELPLLRNAQKTRLKKRDKKSR